MSDSGKCKNPLVAVDLFCGAGGLTHGLAKAGITVAAGIDLDPACKFPFETNNESKFVLRDVTILGADELASLYPAKSTRILVGCAPCQPFSRYARRSGRQDDSKWGLLKHFARLIEGTRPAIISMENVPGLERHDVFADFVGILESLGYHVSHKNVFCPGYGIPQLRTRLVLFASLLGTLQLLPATHQSTEYSTVREAIAGLPRLGRGCVDRKDPLHRACKLSERNVRRIRVSKPGGHWRDWPAELVADCHRVETGKNYVSVYGRMEWNTPAPTITTQFFGFGNGRFGHPEQDRGISLREGAILQSFPRHYKFCPKRSKVSFSVLGRLIGNAVPVRLGEVIGKSIVKHVKERNGQQTIT
ncbi:MAG TPA: DNA (cytosine-5-)-methyltransferase [Tepidisphaeraceae bacterium]|jgi:DNA (cytosine-5)-methyltransferase 1